MIVLVLLAGLLVVTWSPRGPQPGRWGARRREALRQWPRWWARRWSRLDRVPDVAAVVSEVASRLRSGAPIDAAWDRAVDRVLGAGESSGTANVPSGLSRLAERCRADRTAASAVDTVRAATVLAQTLGGPLAEVLDRCARSVVDAERAQDARRVALAGPRSTARVLMGLPLLGLLLGAGLGADPLGTALDGGWGTLAVLTGAGLLVAGARWTRALVAAAQDPAPHRWRRRREAARP